jgi:hypothetical protein
VLRSVFVFYDGFALTNELVAVVTKVIGAAASFNNLNVI